MAVFEHIQNMYDIRLKPRLLHALIKDHLPDEKQPFRSHSELSSVVSAIQIHGLLSETVTKPAVQKQIEKWKSIIDEWVERLLLLVSSKMPDKCWGGICFLGVTCQECSTERFLSSYSDWFHKLLPLIQPQPPSDSHFVKVASCAALSDLFTRLGSYSNVKKDGTSHAGKLIQPVLKLLSDDSSEAICEAAVDLLCTIMKFFPSSIYRHHDSAETIIVSKVRSGKYNRELLKKLAHCLALLPRSKGDEDSWYIMMQKILLSVNAHLSDIFQGLEEETKCNEAIRLLVPPGRDPPPPLGGHTLSKASDLAIKGSDRSPFLQVSTLLICCCTMLASPYPVQVTVPVRPLLALVTRILKVDGSLSQALLPYTTVLQQEFICSELPILHTHCLDLLTATIKGVRSQLLPYAADIARLLTEYFRICTLPSLRINVYSIIRILLTSMGVGMALYLVQEVVDNAILDLDNIGHHGGEASSDVYSLQQHPYHRKRKHASITESSEEHQNRIGLEITKSKEKRTPISVKIAALQALEALLTVGGSLRSECWRPSIDLLLVTVATSACEGRWANGGTFIVYDGPVSNWEEFQLAALHALLASLLSPARIRPPYLSRSLELFRRGKQETGTKLAEFCAHALLALEVLIHPRALPLMDFPSGNDTALGEGFKSSFVEHISAYKKHSTKFSRGPLGVEDPDSGDDLYNSWLDNGEEAEASIPNKQIKHAVGEHSEKDTQHALGNAEAENLLVNALAYPLGPHESNQEPADGVNVEMGEYVDGIMAVSEQSEKLICDASVETSVTSNKMVAVPNDSMAGTESEFRKGVAASAPIPAEGSTILSGMLADNKTDSSEGATFTANDIPAPDEDTFLPTIPVSAKEKGLVFEPDPESSMDSIPDIIDADPDSD